MQRVSLQEGMLIGRKPVSRLVLTGLVLSVCCIVAFNNFQMVLLLFLGFCGVVWCSIRFPSGTVATLLIAGVLPTIFLVTPLFSERYGDLGWGLNMDNVITLAMLVAVMHRFFERRSNIEASRLYKLFALFGLWLLFEILRNIDTYGFSAPGEFRYRYLPLVVLVYVGFFFDDRASRKKLIAVLLVAAVFIPLACIPIIAAIKGWNIGSEHRFMPASIHLGLLFGIMLLLLSRRHGLVRIPRGIEALLVLASAGIVVADGHRSVWLAGMVSLLVLFAFREIELRSVRKYFLLGIGCILILFTLSNAGEKFISYISTRGIAFVNYERDPTANWRVAIWQASTTEIEENLLLGEGFGGYWSFHLQGGRAAVTVSPHSLYIESLIKIGAIGLLLYLFLMVQIGRRFRVFLIQNGAKSDGEVALVLLAFVVLIASHAFYTVYTFDYYSMIFTGLGLAKADST